ncbi:MAG: hypothetical protein ACKVHP_14565 [Verrucomicrobiales bacterium]
MIYQNTDIKTTGIVLGVALVATHIVALLNGKSMRPILKDFPRNRAMGVLLDAAWFKVPETMAWTKLLLPILAYAWIILGMFWVGMPYLMRDQISWLSHNGSRWKSVCIGGLLYGLLTLGCAIAFWS